MRYIFRNSVDSKRPTIQSAPNVFYIFKIHSYSRKECLCLFPLILQYILFTLSYSVPQYLERFVRTGPSGYGEYCAERLCRIKANGERKELPCCLELQVETPNRIFVFLFWWLSRAAHLTWISCEIPDYRIVFFDLNPISSFFSLLTGCKDQEAHRCVCGSNGRPYYQPTSGLSLHFCWSLSGFG